MYTEHFGLVADPFSLTPDPAFLYLSPDHREALAAVQYGLLDGRGFISLIGEVGTGKTTLVYSILGRHQPGIQAAYVSYSAQRFEDLLAGALRDLKVEPTGSTKVALLESLNQYLLRRADEGQVTALILDEAQNLSDETFEELRLLSNFETYSRKLLQIVLVGQPELQDRLRRPRLRQLRERVSVRAYVNPLSREQMRKYIAHRLERAGGDSERLFTPRALKMIVRRSGGIPRRANILCHNALLFAFGRNLDRATHVEAREAIAEMDERRPGRFRRPALSRLRMDSGWGWAVALTAALVAIVMAGRLWSSSPMPQSSTPPASPVAAAPDVVAPGATVPDVVSPGAAVAAVPPPEPVTAPRADVGPEAADAPATVVAAVVSDTVEAAEPVVAPPVDADAETPDTISVVVPEGASLWTLLRDIYGDRFSRTDRARIFRRVRELNPHVTDIHRIFVGDRLRLPAPPEADAMAGRAE